jgi:thiamine biosynthesis lipoprotein
LLDARTGRPSESRWREVTVVAGTCVAADVAAKTAFLLDEKGPRWLAGQGLRGRFIDAKGIAIDTLGLEASAAKPPTPGRKTGLPSAPRGPVA